MRESTYRFGDVEVEAGGREVRRGGTRVALEPKALDVLLLLLADAGRVVEKRRLLGEVWADVHVTDSSLARAVTQVRRASATTSGRRATSRPCRRAAIGSSARSQPPLARRRLETASHSAGSWRGPRPTARRRDCRARRSARAGVWPCVLVALVAGRHRLVWRGAASQAAPADLGAMLLSAIAHDAVQVTTSRGLDADPALSPDGSAVAYASDASGALEIHVRPRLAGATAGRSPTTAATTSIRRGRPMGSGSPTTRAVSAASGWCRPPGDRHGNWWPTGPSPSWSPDGRTLVFQTAGEADILGGTGGSPSTLRLVDVATGAGRGADPGGRPSQARTAVPSGCRATTA